MSAEFPRGLDALVASVVTPAFDAAADAAAATVDRVVLDTVAVTVAGARTPEHAALLDARSVPADGRAATVLADEPRWAPPPIAAFLNGTAVVAHELDELLVDGGHPAAHVVPAALAAAQEHGADGRALRHAVAAGYEVAARLHRVRKPVFPAHPHGLIGTIGAAVAVARLAGVDPVVAARAAGTLGATATWEACFAGATARNAWTGTAAMLGVLAADLARAGMDGAPAAPDELHSVFGIEPVAVAPWSSDESLLVGRSALRRHAVAGPLQSAVEAALALHETVPGPLRAVRVETFASNGKFDRPSAGNALSGRFSLPTAVAAALTAGHVGVEPFGADPAVLALAARVEVRVADDIDAAWPERPGARVTVTGTDGDEHTVTVELPAGHPRRPLDDAEWRARIAGLAPHHDLTARGLGELRAVDDLLEVTG